MKKNLKINNTQSIVFILLGVGGMVYGTYAYAFQNLHFFGIFLIISGALSITYSNYIYARYVENLTVKKAFIKSFSNIFYWFVLFLIIKYLGRNRG